MHDTLGFSFDRKDWEWHGQYAKLVAFKEEHGHCRVPSFYKDPILAKCVITQRRKYKQKVEGKGKMEES
jgi:hypothetical protein